MTIRRRDLLFGAAALAATRAASAEDRFAAIEQRLGGRIGVAALDTGSGTMLGHRADERFAMASTFKWMLVALVLKRSDQGQIKLDEPIAYGEADLFPYAPTTRAHVAEGKLSIAALCEAAVELSDNTAANLLLKRVGGAPALTDFLRGTGDRFTRLDRMEMALNSNLPGDPRDTTTPHAMVGTLKRLLLGETLTSGSRDRLIGWMKNCQTGKQRLRAGLPPEWLVGDKTGTGENGAVNDVAIAWPADGRAPILIASYMSGSKAPDDKLSAGHADIARILTAQLR